MTPAVAYPPPAPQLVSQQPPLPLQLMPHYAAASSFAPQYGMQHNSYSYYPATMQPQQGSWSAMPYSALAPPVVPSLSQLQQLTHEQSVQLHHQRMQQQQIEMEHAAAAQAHDMQACAHRQAQQHAAMMQQPQHQQQQPQSVSQPPSTKPPNMMMPTHLLPRSPAMYLGAHQWQPQQHAPQMPMPLHPSQLMYSPHHAPMPMMQPTQHYSPFSSGSSGGGLHLPRFALPGDNATPTSAASTALVYGHSDSSLSSPATRSTIAETVVKLELPSAATTTAALASASAGSTALQKPSVSSPARRLQHSPARTHTPVTIAAHPAAAQPAKASVTKIVALESPTPVRISASHRKRRRPQRAIGSLAQGSSRVRSPAAAAAAAASAAAGSDDSGPFPLRMDSRRMSKPTRERIMQDARFNCNIECGVRPSRWPPAAAAAAEAKAEEDSAASSATPIAAAASSSSSRSSPPDASASPPSAAAAADSSDQLEDDELLDDEGYVVRSASDRVYSAYSPFFGSVVEMFVASSDPYPGRILFRAAALAHKAECSLNRVAMYLARQRGSEAGIFQALSFSRKLRGCPGLKRGGYFVSILACEIYLERCKMLTHRKLLTPVQFRSGTATAGSTAVTEATGSKTRSGGGLLGTLSTAAAASEKADSSAAAAAAAAVSSPASASIASPASASSCAAPTRAATAVSPLAFSRWQVYLGLEESGSGECSNDYPVDVFPPSLRQPTLTRSSSASAPSSADRRAAVQLVAAQDRAIESYLRQRLQQWTESFTARLSVGLGDDDEPRDEYAAAAAAEDGEEESEEEEEEEE